MEVVFQLVMVAVVDTAEVEEQDQHQEDVEEKCKLVVEIVVCQDNHHVQVGENVN